MLGAITGDIAGSRYEFDPQKDLKFEPFRETSRFTDDTALTVASAHAILDDPETPHFEAYFQLWGHKYPKVGYGPRFKKWLADPTSVPTDSWGNGCAMRVSPVGWSYPTREETLRVAEISAIPTHNHEESIEAAKAVADIIFLARKNPDKSKDWILSKLMDWCSYDLDRTIEGIRPTYQFQVRAGLSVPEAIIAFKESTDFMSSIKLAISLGGDADTQGCIAGALAEAYYGFPEELRKTVYWYLPEDMIEIIERFQSSI